MDDAAIDAGRYADQFDNGIEYGGWIIKRGNCWAYGFMAGTDTGLDPETLELLRPDGARILWHTHPEVGDGAYDTWREENFSGNPNDWQSGDLWTAEWHDIRIYLHTPSGNNKVYEPREREKGHLKAFARDLENKEPERCSCFE